MNKKSYILKKWRVRIFIICLKVEIVDQIPLRAHKKGIEINFSKLENGKWRRTLSDTCPIWCLHTFMIFASCKITQAKKTTWHSVHSLDIKYVGDTPHGVVVDEKIFEASKMQSNMVPISFDSLEMKIHSDIAVIVKFSALRLEDKANVHSLYLNLKLLKSTLSACKCASLSG